MKKTLMVALAFVLVIAMSVAGTFAYLTSTASVTNTFTVGKVAITLDEAKVTSVGTPIAGEDRVAENEYKLIPGHSYTKDPTIHVDANSEDCWLFVKVENGLANYEAEGEGTIAAQMKAKGWEPISEGSNVYAYNTTVAAGADVKVFESFTVAGNADVSDVTEETKIVVTAYAIQADGFTTAADAWNAANLA